MGQDKVGLYLFRIGVIFVYPEDYTFGHLLLLQTFVFLLPAFIPPSVANLLL